MAGSNAHPPTSAGATGALAALALSMLIAALGVSIANVALPALATAFSASFSAVQWVVIIYLLASTVTIVSLGRLGDRIGHRRVLTGGLVLFGFAAVIAIFAFDLRMLLIARVIQGIGAAILMALTVALVRETMPKEQIGRAMGLLGTMSAVGTALGPAIGGLLITAFGWQAIFVIMIPITALALWLVYHFLPPDRVRPDPVGGLDPVGTVLLAIALGAYALAMTMGGMRADLGNLALLGTALLAGAGFVVVEMRVPAPLIKLSSLGNPVLASGLVTSALVAMVMMTTLVVGPFFLSRALGLNAAEVGGVMAVGPILSTLSGVPAGALVDRIGSVRMVRLGLGGMALGALCLAILPGTFGVPGYLGAALILSPTYQLFQAANNTVVMMQADADERGVISGLLNLARNLGLLTGASLMGAVFTHAAGVPDIATASGSNLQIGMRVTFLVASGVMVTALVIALIGGRKAVSADP